MKTHTENKTNASTWHELPASKLRLWNALASLIEENQEATIGVSQICQRAGVNRSTFYKHFSDKTELLRFGLSEVMIRNVGIPRNAFGDPAAKPHLQLLSHAQQHLKFWKPLLTGGRFPEYVVAEFMTEGAVRFSCESIDSAYVNGVPAEVWARMHYGGVSFVLIWWIKEDCKTPLEQLDQYIQHFWKEMAKLCQDMH